MYGPMEALELGIVDSDIDIKFPIGVNMISAARARELVEQQRPRIVSGLINDAANNGLREVYIDSYLLSDAIIQELEDTGFELIQSSTLSKMIVRW